jgi:hypothetical protein
MATDPTEQEEHAANTANADAAHREAYDYWGYLFQEDKCGTPKLNRLLKGIAEVIVSAGQPPDLMLLGRTGADACRCRAGSLSPATRLI